VHYKVFYSLTYRTVSGHDKEALVGPSVCGGGASVLGWVTIFTGAQGKAYNPGWGLLSVRRQCSVWEHSAVLLDAMMDHVTTGTS